LEKITFMAVRPQSVLFVCSSNAIRSVLAEAIARHYFGRSIYVDSAGVRPGGRDEFVTAVLEEIGLDGRTRHRPKSLDDLEESGFDLIITLSPQAHHAALEWARGMAIAVEYWPTSDPSLQEGSREQKLDAYRAVRDGLKTQIRNRLTL
jgi:protein-tyrosine-phosphatase